ncbi:glycoside hydrolase family 1 protein [Polychaeton citri CBS 116435]|uniref:beta-glucosidase n=1 Tax=Polychaeton citri CBS 116435 TaxID=1314669 RepID=A0A9P4Q668_9PEZI|nr:glycoside hydrolase family 1 protein [Polychaeton citri CBS 116435]
MASARLPSDFLWGYATASYQIEGAAAEDGRGPSIWDSFCQIPGKIADGSSGAVACDSYHRFRDDVALMKRLGAQAYRFSVSWSRVIPLGGRGDPVNQKGLQFYIDLIDELRANEIEPLVTLYHWDLPQALYDRYGGFLNKEEYVADFVNYAQIMFEALSSRVKYWITYNEPLISCTLGYSLGIAAPGHTSDRSKSSVGDSSTEPWIVAHHILISHAKAVQLYRERFKPIHGGVIGITLNGDWGEPWNVDDPEDVAACQRKMEFAIGLFADPIYIGDYPASVRLQLGDRIPSFTDEERNLIMGSNDFYGMNHYCTAYVKHKSTPPAAEDFLGNFELFDENKEGHVIGPETECPWLRPYAPGFRRLLNWISRRYDRPPIYVTENGTSIKGENDLSKEEILQDDFRAGYFRDYLNALAEAYTFDNVDVRGYMAWSLLDNFEWDAGYNVRFGVTYVDYTDQSRYPKKSAKVVAEIFKELTARSA